MVITIENFNPVALQNILPLYFNSRSVFCILNGIFFYIVKNIKRRVRLETIEALERCCFVFFPAFLLTSCKLPLKLTTTQEGKLKLWFLFCADNS